MDSVDFEKERSECNATYRAIECRILFSAALPSHAYATPFFNISIFCCITSHSRFCIPYLISASSLSLFQIMMKTSRFRVRFIAIVFATWLPSTSVKELVRPSAGSSNFAITRAAMCPLWLVTRQMRYAKCYCQRMWPILNTAISVASFLSGSLFPLDPHCHNS